MAAEQTLCLLPSWFFFLPCVPNPFAGEFTTIREFQLPIGMSWRPGPSLIGGKCIFHEGPRLLRTKPRCSAEYRHWLVVRRTILRGDQTCRDRVWYLDLVTRLGNPVMLITTEALRHTSEWGLRVKKQKQKTYLLQEANHSDPVIMLPVIKSIFLHYVWLGVINGRCWRRLQWKYSISMTCNPGKYIFF